MVNLDLSNIAVIDQHCHPIVREQHMDVVRFRSYCTEATHPDFAHLHVPNTVYYMWLLRQLASFYQCPVDEQAIMSARNGMTADDLLHHLVQSAHIDTLILDPAYPQPSDCYSVEQIGHAGQCHVAQMLRLETMMQRIIVEQEDFDAVTARFSSALQNLRGQGYCALKSVVAYRSGLAIAEWGKDAAVVAFKETRAEVVRTGNLRINQKPLIDYLLHIAFTHAAEQHIPVQFHTGYGDSDTDMRLGNPLHLRCVLERREYWTMPIILLHESYPYCQLGAYLAAVYPHVYFDLSYTIPFLDKLEMLAFTRQALGIAPASKLVYSSDGINIPEMHWAAAVRGRQVLAQVLQEMIDVDEIDESQAYTIAQRILYENAHTLYAG
ncbi:MAG TPA: amidohydrolase family protein [Ktedonobacteraceae bacterium]